MTVLVSIDTSQIEIVSRNIERSAKETQRILRMNLTKTTKKLVDELNDAAPSQTRHDPRHAHKLNESFYMDDSGGDVREIRTLEPKKLAIVTLGTAPHMIRPLFKKALWWPGLSNPVAYVRHPGTNPNYFVDETFAKHDFDSGAQEVVDTLVSVITHGPSMSQPVDFEGANGGWKKYV